MDAFVQNSWWRRGRRVPLCAAGLLVAHAAALAYLCFKHSPTIDEVGHLPSGLSYYHFGTFSLYKVNPPLVKVLAALPAWLEGAKTDWRNTYGGFTIRPEWIVGADFAVANGPDVFHYFALGRLMCIPLSVLGALTCYRWASDVYGPVSGLCALALWCVSPTLLAHGALITPDMGATGIGVFAAYCFRRWLVRPTWSRALVAGLALGLCELTKMTWVVLFVLWPLLWTVWLLGTRRDRTFPLGAQAAQLVAVLVTGLYVLNAGYLFEGTGTKLGAFDFVSESLGGVRPDDPSPTASGNRFRGTVLADVPSLVPSTYLTGLDLQKMDFERPQWSYLRGEYRCGGWWYYYIYALAVKEPLGLWLAVLLAACCSFRRSPAASGWRDEALLLLPIVTILTLVSAQTAFNHHSRYVMPILPFLSIWTSRLFAVRANVSRGIRLVALACAFWILVSCARVYPYTLSYFNELAGGPENGHYHLGNSNTDWGQDMFELKCWCDQHPEAKPLYCKLENRLGYSFYGIEAEHTQSDHAPGWYAISVNQLHPLGGRSGFSDLTIVDRVGYSIMIGRRE